MGEPNNLGVTDARNFFSELIQNVMAKQQVTAKPGSFEYLVDLLLRYMQSDRFFKKSSEGKLEDNVLVTLYSDFLKADAATKRTSLQRLGDICLLVSGFFSESLRRKLVDVDYYLGMGGSAYFHLSQMQWTGITQTLYRELASKIKSYSSVLEEVSERSGIQTNSDVLRLYEKWLITGNDRLKGLLSEHGIHAPIFVDIKTRH